MPPSQLKRLKSSLREHGIVGPQQSKKQKKQGGKNGQTKDKRVQRNAALHGIREQFNPFEVKVPARGSKYDFTNGGSSGGKIGKGVVGRPGVTKGLGEETRRKTLLVEMQRRQKVGGIMDRRFGENDPTMAPEEKALERFVKEKQRGSKRDSLFNLEDEEGDQEELTHFGRSLSLTGTKRLDDYDEAEMSDSNDDDAYAEGERRSRKRRRLLDTSSADGFVSDMEGPIAPERAKTKQEVMKEVIAKSKLHKYERQKVKEDDDDLRAELDQGMSDIYALMRGRQGPSEVQPTRDAIPVESSMNPDRAALLGGKDRSLADKEYDERLRQMAFDARSKPTERTKTEEERLSEEAQKLKELEEKRLARMRGEDSGSDADGDSPRLNLEGDEDMGGDETDPLGLGRGIPTTDQREHLDVEDEDDFVLDDNLIASGSDVVDTSEDESDGGSVASSSSDDDKEFTEGLLSKEDAGREGLDPRTGHKKTSMSTESASTLAFTYSCPQTHEELLGIMEKVTVSDLPTVIQRIRALYHPKLNGDNKSKLGVFSAILVDHLSYLANLPTHPPFTVLEALIRHIHSLAKSFPLEVGRAFRARLKSLNEARPTSPTPGDLMIFTAIASMFPTSDHFHQVVTPAILSMGRYLGQKVPRSLSDLTTGTYLATLCLQYQRLSKRYIPEVVNYVANALHSLAPVKPTQGLGYFPHHELPASLRITSMPPVSENRRRQLKFWDISHIDGYTMEADEEVKLGLIETNLALVDAMIELWVGKSAFIEIFDPFSKILGYLSSTPCSSKLPSITQDKIRTTLTKLQRLLQQARINRRPLLLHHHRPLAIKTSIPKFEESYNPDKHYDPDRDRAELGKLKAEYKRERKGAMRELRKDANFIARENLREKKERDAQYERKYKRLVAEIQGEEGREANAYEREKRMRKGKGKGKGGR
ncbi:MAG: hypothetical protein Q9187_001984 [Circinaria calcarea]